MSRFRGTPEANRPCSIADRQRIYRIHIDTLRKIQNSSGKMSPPRPPKRLLPGSKVSFRSAPYEVMKRIPESAPPEKNFKGRDSANRCSSAKDLEHQRQVLRLMSSSYNYGLPTQVLKTVCAFERQENGYSFDGDEGF